MGLHDTKEYDASYTKLVVAFDAAHETYDQSGYLICSDMVLNTQCLSPITLELNTQSVYPVSFPANSLQSFISSILVMESNTGLHGHILNLPTEILDQITGYLNDEVLPTLRLTCKTLHAAISDRFCDVYIAHLGCWVISKDRWERLHNLLTASGRPVSGKVRTITLTMDELELRTTEDFVSVSGFPYNRANWEYVRRNVGLEQYCQAEHNIAMEAAAVERHGAADLAVILRVLEQAKLHGCFTRLELSPANPLANKKPPLHARAQEVQIHLQQAITQVKPRVESISLDRVRHRCLEETLVGLEDEVCEPFASLRESTLTPIIGDYRRWHRVKDLEIARAMLTSSQHLRKLYLQVSCVLVGKGNHGRVQRWTPYLLLANGLGELESLTLMWVPLLLDDLLEILRRCSRALTHLDLRLDPKANRGDAWLDLWEQLASMERVYHLRLENPFDRTARTGFVGRGEISRGLARLVEVETSRE